MKTKILVLGLACFLFFGCYMNYAQRIVFYQQVPDILYDQMISVLESMGYTITTDEKIPDPILTKNPFMIAKKEKHKVMVTFIRKESETSIEIHVSQIGEKVKTEVLEKIRDEVAKKFEEQIKK